MSGTPEDTKSQHLNRLKLLNLMLKKERATPDEPLARVPLRNHSQQIPLSFAQESLWFIDQLFPGNAFYNIPALMRLTGPLQVELLEQCLKMLAQRHEILRATIVDVDGLPQQVFKTNLAIHLPIIDLKHITPRTLVEQEVQKLTLQEAQRAFSLAEGPLWRTTLLRLDEEEYMLLLTIHHILADGWSLVLFFRELAHLYTALRTGISSSLPTLPIQYADFALWQRQWLQEERLENHLAYWRQQLAGIPETCTFPTDHLQSTPQIAPGALHAFVLPTELAEQVSRLGRQEGASLFMMLLATFQLLFYRYTGKEDIVIGSPIAGRNRSEVEDLIGFFVNMQVLRTNLSPTITFRDLLRQVRTVTLDAYTHQDVPFERIVEEIQPRRDPAHHPLFQIAFGLQTTPEEVLVAADLHIDLVEGENGQAQFDLEVRVVETSGQIKVFLIYKTGLFDAVSIDRLQRHFQTLLESVIQHPDQRLSDVPLLTATEYRQILEEWNEPTKDLAEDEVVHTLFEKQVARTPDAVALVFQDEHITYQELDRRANFFARYLQSFQIALEEPVGVCLERTPSLIAILLGILKAGGTYVPLDPTYPEERLHIMLSDARITLLFTQKQLYHKFQATNVNIIDVDANRQIFPDEMQLPFFNQVFPQNLAYIMYTSGSTGKPKGIGITHRSIIDLVRQTNYIQIQPSDTIALASNISFDASTFEIWGALLNGACLVSLSKSVLLSPKEIVEAFKQQNISILSLTTALFNQIVQEMPQAFRALRCLLFGGEAADPYWVRELLKSQPPERFLHLYGPTETTAFASWHLIEAHQENAEMIPIGFPLTNTQLYILDQNMQLVPVGVPGELYIGGSGLARGYLHRPDLTAEYFRPNPFSVQDGALLYKTGDIVRYLPHGEIEYLGRFDNQIKIRGFRIELEEIEEVLRKHPQVSNCIIRMRRDASGNKQIVAYVASPSKATLPIGELRSYFSEKLPEYMHPALYALVDTLPLTPNGKVDLVALAKVPLVASEQSESQHPTQLSPVETTLSSIWCDLLGVEQIGIHDNFFEVGGHSLLATQIVSRLRAVLKIAIPLRSVFDAPTIAKLSKIIETMLRNQDYVSESQPIYLQQRDRFPLSFAQQRLWFVAQLENHPYVYTVSTVLRFTGAFNEVALRKSLRTLVQRHETLRTTFVVVGDEPMQIVAPFTEQTLPALSIHHLRSEEGKMELRRLIREEAEKPFNLTEGPLFRSYLFYINEQEPLLLLTMHHIISDGWSLNLLVHELSELYKTFCEETPVSLLALPIQYGDFAVWQRHWLQENILANQLAYWTQQLHNLPQLSLPLDHQRPTVQTHSGAYQRIVLPASIRDEYKHLSQRQGVTLFMTLLAVFEVLLYRYTGQEDLVIGTDIANRNLHTIEKLIGFFVNQLVLRVDASSNPTFLELLSRVGEVTLKAYMHQDLPFEKLVEVISPQRNLNRSPLFQVKFTLQNMYQTQEVFYGFTIDQQIYENDAVPFDLMLAWEETPDGLVGKLLYNTDLFEATTIARMGEHLQTLLEATLRNPKQHIAELPLLPANQYKQLLAISQGPHIQRPALCLHQLFEQHVKRTPEAAAAVFNGQTITFAVLNEHANQLASYLQKRGVRPEVPVGLSMEASIDVLVGLLAILKAGGVYVPLDPTYPAERLAFMMRDAKIRFLLTQEALRGHFAQEQYNVISLDTEWHVVAAEPKENPQSAVTEHNLAYVMYTSGSTGLPKGVLIEHASIVNLMQCLIEEYDIGQDSRVVQFSPLSFDISLANIFMALGAGATLCLINQETVTDGVRLVHFFREQDISHARLPPAVMTALPNVHLPALRFCLLGGEMWSMSEFSDRKYRFFNEYGQTETGPCMSMRECFADDGVPLVGSAMANMQMYVLDAHLQPLPVGIPGELYVAGCGLGRGYHHLPDLTAEKFLPDPFSTEPGARLYKTNDKGRYLLNGGIEFLGRIDRQIKLRGFRIELGEIESLLEQYPGVQQSIVLLREDPSGTKRILAYVVARGQGELSARELRSYLRDRLLEYMLPSAFAILNSFPLTPNGKVDHKALPEPHHSELEVFVSPHGPIEEILAGIWCELLEVPSIGSNENFFELGGHSLLAAQVKARVYQAFHLELPLQALFDFPTVAEMAKRIETLLKPHVQQEEPALKPVTQEGVPLPLSFAQERLWFLSLVNPDSAVYNTPAIIRIQGSLDQKILAQSLEKLIRRHNVFRLLFRLEEGRPTQTVQPYTALPLEYRDLTDSAIEEREAIIQQLTDEIVHQPIKLLSEPMLRITLVKCDADTHLLLLRMHHIISDARSMDILWRELWSLYETNLQGRPSPSPESTLQYTDFAVWQRLWLQEEIFQAQLDYWKKQLANVPVLQLKTDYPRPAVQTYAGATQTLLLSAQLSREIKDLSGREKVTPFMTLLSAFAVLLARYSGQQDIAIGTPISQRMRTELEDVIGLFLNTLVLRINLTGIANFLQLLTHVREVALDAYAHQDIPFEKVVDELVIQRDLSRSPLFQVTFVFQEELMPAKQVADLEVSTIPIETGTAKFDFTLSVTDKGQQLSTTVEYNTNLFAANTITRLLAHWQILLERLVANPMISGMHFPLLSEEEQHQILEVWNATARSYPAYRNLPQLLEAQAIRTPDAVALMYGDEALTYSELHARANQLARYLRHMNVGPEVLVGVCVERSLPLVISLLGTLKAGGAYVPLDPAYPRERLDFILQDSGATVLLTQEKFAGMFAQLATQTICLDTDWEAITHEDDSFCENWSYPSNVAYVIYTSGSTGYPKGVAISHANALAFIQGVRHTFTMEELSYVLASTSVCFDLSIFELFVPLSCGGTSILIENILHLPHLIQRDFVTLFNAVPSVMDKLLQNAGIPCNIQTVNLGGEALSDTLVEKIYSHKVPRVYNLYGPTEATTYITYLLEPQSGRAPSIGYPVSNAQVYILDDLLQPVPVGVIGELYCGGAGVATGYRNRPDLTAERFIPHPFSEEAGARLYRTGDFACYQEDGSIDFLGRRDQQRKLRGFRIELGEIEFMLQQHFKVHKCVLQVQALEGIEHLVAYVVPVKQGQTSHTELKDYLQEKLPAFMIPEVFVWLPELPLMPNGKVNYRELPVPTTPRNEHEGEVALPRNEIERTIVQCWQEVLNTNQMIDIHDNFFEVGGNSLLLVQLHKQLSERIESSLSIVDLFKYPTVNSLATALHREQQKAPSTASPLPHSSSRRESLKERRKRKQN